MPEHFTCTRHLTINFDGVLAPVVIPDFQEDVIKALYRCRHSNIAIQFVRRQHGVSINEAMDICDFIAGYPIKED